MSTLFVAARAVHYASAMLLFGELVFVFVVAAPAWRGALVPGSGGGDDLRRRLLPIARWSVVASLVSGVAWLALAAAAMSGTPIEQALNPDILWLVLGKTTFGRVWMLRLGLVAVFCVLLLGLARSARDHVRSRLMIGMLALAAAYLATLAWTGHAAAGQGLDGDIGDRFRCRAPSRFRRLARRAAGARLPARPRAAARGGGARDAAIFDAGRVCVALLTASGLVNAWYLVGDVPALIGTDYGRLLLAKLALFAAMLVLAMANRWYLSVRLAGGDREALRLLRRNAIAGNGRGNRRRDHRRRARRHAPRSPSASLWPFDHTLSWDRVEQSAWLQMAVAAAGMIACVSAGVALGSAPSTGEAMAGGTRRHRGVAPRYSPGCSPCRRTRPPMPRRRSPIRRTRLPAAPCSTRRTAARATVASAAATARLARSLPTKPTDLTEHASRHREGRALLVDRPRHSRNADARVLRRV